MPQTKKFDDVSCFAAEALPSLPWPEPRLTGWYHRVGRAKADSFGLQLPTSDKAPSRTQKRPSKCYKS